MAWECAECNIRESPKSKIKVDTVCHHCGKPLCREDRILVKDDDAFSINVSQHDAPPDHGAESEGEADDYEPELNDEFEMGLGGGMVADAGGPMTRDAYHCKDCKKKYHAKANVVGGRPA
jgi:hypothetical protein